MFDLLPEAVHLLRIVAVVLEGTLRDDLAPVQVGVHPMDADAIDLDAVGDILRIATYNYMNGLALDRPASKWFKSITRPRSR